MSIEKNLEREISIVKNDDSLTDQQKAEQINELQIEAQWYYDEEEKKENNG